MQILLIELAFGAAMASAGIAGGWWLRSRPGKRDAGHEEERRRTREVLGRLQDLAVHIAANVGEHSSRVEEINQELSAADRQESDTVVSAVAKLIQANARMQQQLHSAEQKLHDQARLVEAHAAEARTDALTQLANRRAFDDDLTRRAAEFHRYGRPFCVVLADIDHFKRVNDTHGHAAGDQVLRGVARVLRKTARETDLVARYGGEEFAVVLPETTAAEASRLASRLRQAVEASRFRCEAGQLKVTISLGVAEPGRGEETPSLINRTDAALYASKAAGRNRGHMHDGQAPQPIVEAPAVVPEAKKTPEPPPAPVVAAQPAAAPTPPPQPAPQSTADDSRRERPKTIATRGEFCTALGRRLSEWRRGGSVPAVLMVRIDRFPEIIARWGRDAGGLVLRATSQFLTAAIREMDMAAEYEQGTFAMLLPGASLGAVTGIAERLRQAIARCALPLHNGPLQFTVSIAGSVTIKNDETQTLLWRTEEALDVAAKAGGNASYFHNGQWAETVEAAMERSHAAAT
jgi:diguanylate cyclase